MILNILRDQVMSRIWHFSLRYLIVSEKVQSLHQKKFIADVRYRYLLIECVYIYHTFAFKIIVTKVKKNVERWAKITKFYIKYLILRLKNKH